MTYGIDYDASAMQLSFDYDASANCELAHYRGLTIRVERDENAECPFSAWDCEPPTLVFSGRNSISDYSNGELQSPLDHISDGKLRLSRYWKAAAQALGLSPVAFRAECEQEARDYECSVVAVTREKLQEALDDARPTYYSGNAGDYCAALAELWRLAGYAAHDWTSQGYSQGDYADGLSVATPDWIKKTGAPADSHAEHLKYAGRLWGYWAWGDVYAFVIESAQGDILYSCAGFYGSCHKESGLAEAAKEAADCIIARARSST